MVGSTVSHYRILEKLGGGGMGVVYKAQDLKLDRPVALKFLPPDLTRDPDAKQRFIHEARAASALQHTNICVVYDIDESDDGQMFISMEYLPGETLKKKIERGPLKIDDAIQIAAQVACGLGKAHEHGIVHRDVKPANVMITADGVAKIVDFGLAKMSRRTMLTKAGSTLGTASYMSPEQAQGEDADSRTDIWSLGVMLYEMLTGLLPFTAEYEQGLIYQILNSAPPALSGVRTGIPLELEHIIAKCLEKRRDERYQTAADLIADLRHLQRSRGGSDTAPQVIPAAVGTPRRRRWWYWKVPAIILIAIAAFFILRMPPQAPVSEEQSIAVLPFVDMSPQRDQEYFCDGMTDELTNRLSKIRGVRVPARTSAFMFKGKTGDIREIGSKLNVRAVLEGSVRKAGDGLRITAQLINVADGYHLWSETYDRKLEDVFAIQDDISSAIVKALELELTSQERERISERPIDDIRAYDFYLKATRRMDRFDEKSLDSAFMFLRTAIDIMGDNAELYSGMARAYSMYANIGVGQEEYIRLSEQYVEKALALKPDLVSALAARAVLSAYKPYPENHLEAFSCYRKAMAVSPFDTRILHGMSSHYDDIGRPSEASAWAALLEQHDPLNPWRHIARGFTYQYNCQFPQALEEFRKYYQSDSTSPLAQTVYSLGLAHNGRRDEALAVIDRMERGRDGKIAPDSRSTFPVFSLLLKYALLKDTKNALRVMTSEFQKTCKRDYEWSYWVASRLSLLGEKELALDWLENAIIRGFINYPLFQCDPAFNNIRHEARFVELMKRAKYEWEHFEVPP
jgi:TolB-like protein